MRICSKCKQNKELVEFNKSKDRGKDGRHNICKACLAEYYQANKAARQAYQRQYLSTERVQTMVKAARRNNVNRFGGGRTSARLRGLTWELTLQQWADIVIGQTCHYCNGTLPDAGIALDRKENNMGYTLANVVPCCTNCNSFKRHYLTYNEMVAAINLLKGMRNGPLWG